MVKRLQVPTHGPPIVICVTGSRHWCDRGAIHGDLRAVEASGRLACVIEGDGPGDPGADRIAGRMWASKARARGVGWVSFPPKCHQAWAYHERNQQMVDYLVQAREMGWRPVVLAYPLPDSRGTVNTMERAEAAGVKTYVRS